jgi:tetratricopeptide (TPR) repeat protein
VNDKEYAMKQLLITMLTSITMFGFGQGQDTLLQKGKGFFDTKEYSKAKEFFENILDQDDENAEAHHWLGRTYFTLGEIDEASDHCEKSVELDETNADYHFWYGQVLGREVQEASIFRKPFLAPKVLEEFERTIELDPKHVGGHIGAARYYLQAPGIMGGDVEKAKEQAQILINLGDAQGNFLMVQIIEQQEGFEKAADAYAEADKDNPNFYNSYGYFLLKHKKYDLAIEKFKKQVELSPGSANSYDSLGDGYRAAGKLEAALSSYKKAVELDPNFKASINNIEEIEKKLYK